MTTSTGGFFATERHPLTAAPSGGWRPFAKLVHDREALDARLSQIRAGLATMTQQTESDVELRVAGSVAHLGLAARLVSPYLASAATDDWLDLRLGSLWWQPELGGTFPLSVPAEPRPDNASARAAVTETMQELTAAVADRCAVSEHVLWGNVASAVNGALLMLTSTPDRYPAAFGVAAALLAELPVGEGESLVGPGFRRSSCCLMYRLGEAGASAVCGDCVLAR